MSRQHTVEKIGGTSMTFFGDIMNNVIIGSRSGAELYNRIFVVSAYGGITNLLLETKKPANPVFTAHSPRAATSGKKNWRKPAAK